MSQPEHANRRLDRRSAETHEPSIAVEMLPCADRFWRNFFRPVCSCGWRGLLMNYRQQAWQEAANHAA